MESLLQLARHLPGPRRGAKQDQNRPSHVAFDDAAGHEGDEGNADGKQDARESEQQILAGILKEPPTPPEFRTLLTLFTFKATISALKMA